MPCQNSTFSAEMQDNRQITHALYNLKLKINCIIDTDKVNYTSHFAWLCKKLVSFKVKTVKYGMRCV